MADDQRCGSAHPANSSLTCDRPSVHLGQHAGKTFFGTTTRLSVVYSSWGERTPVGRTAPHEGVDTSEGSRCGNPHPRALERFCTRPVAHEGRHEYQQTHGPVYWWTDVRGTTGFEPALRTS